MSHLILTADTDADMATGAGAGAGTGVQHTDNSWSTGGGTAGQGGWDDGGSGSGSGSGAVQVSLLAPEALTRCNPSDISAFQSAMLAVRGSRGAMQDGGVGRMLVDRQLADGDWLLLNRTPSRWRQNIMAVRVQVMPSSCPTLQLNPQVRGLLRRQAGRQTGGWVGITTG